MKEFVKSWAVQKIKRKANYQGPGRNGNSASLGIRPTAISIHQLQTSFLWGVSPLQILMPRVLGEGFRKALHGSCMSIAHRAWQMLAAQ